MALANVFVLVAILIGLVVLVLRTILVIVLIVHV